MKRSVFAVGAGAMLAFPAALSASGPLTIVCVTCSDDNGEIAQQAEDELAGALLDRGVRVADPSAIQERFRERGRAAIVAFWGGAVMAWESVSWVERVYHARRLFAAQVVVTDSTLPYGAFQVHQTRVRLSYKCYDVETHELVAAGSKNARAQGEDVTDAIDEALASAIKESVASAASRLT